MNKEIIKRLKDLRINSGFSCAKIYYILREEGFKITRNQVKDILIDLKLMSPNLSHGGYRSGSGKGTKYLFDGIILDSYAELCFYLKYRNSLGLLKVKDPIKVNNYNYTPDFIDKFLRYYEIKSHQSDDLWGWNISKFQNFPYPLIVVSKQDLTSIISEIESIYGLSYLNSLKRVGSFSHL